MVRGLVINPASQQQVTGTCAAADCETGIRFMGDHSPKNSEISKPSFVMRNTKVFCSKRELHRA